MGWASGSQVAKYFIGGMCSHLDMSYEKRMAIYVTFIDAMRMADWDTIEEVLGEDPAFDDAVVRVLTPDEEWWEICLNDMHPDSKERKKYVENRNRSRS